MAEPAPAAAATSERVPLSLAVAIFAALSLTCAFTSQGFLEADGCTHYLYSRFAFQYPAYFVDIWGRPFKTALYAPAAATVGLMGVRITSLCVAITIGLTAMAIARGQGYRWPVLAVIFTFAQPLVFLHSFSELTELPFAMLLGFAFLAYQRERWLALSILAALLPLSRPEGFGFLILAAGLLGWHRKWLLLPVLVVPIVAWQIAGAIIYQEPGNWWRWLPRHWPYAGESVYQAGPAWHFLRFLPAVTGPLVFPFVLIGAWQGLRGSGDGPLDAHRRRCDVMIVVIPVMIFIGHSVLYALGKMASNGELRYLLIVAPFWALLACRGWGWAWAALPSAGPAGGAEVPAATGGAFQPPVYASTRHPIVWAAIAAVVPAAANLMYMVLPLGKTPDWDMAERMVRWYQQSGLEQAYPHVMSAHPAIFYHLDVAPVDPRVRPWQTRNLRQLPPGTVMFFDPMYSYFNADREKTADARMFEQLAAANVVCPQFRLVPDELHGYLDSQHWLVLLSPERADGNPTKARQQELRISNSRSLSRRVDGRVAADVPGWYQ